jgi:hypothetical protein
MPKTKRDASRKDKVNNYKKQHKKELIMSQVQNNLPETREVPTWNPNELIEVTGTEFEMIYNGITQLQSIFTSAQSIMSRNLLNGRIRMNFEKLVNTENGPIYVPMTEEEQAPRREEYQKLINSILSQQKAASEPLPVVDDSMPEELTHVDDSGVPIIQLNP